MSTCWLTFLYMEFSNELVGVKFEILADFTIVVAVIVPLAEIAVFACTVVQLFDDIVDGIGAGDGFAPNLDRMVFDQCAELNKSFVSSQRPGDFGPFGLCEFTGAEVVLAKFDGHLRAVCHDKYLLMIIHEYTRDLSIIFCCYFDFGIVLF